MECKSHAVVVDVWAIAHVPACACPGAASATQSLSATLTASWHARPCACAPAAHHLATVVRAVAGRW